jgi:type I restriction enzyme S subunit
MTDWLVKTLGDVCDLVGGGTPSKDRPEFYGGDIPWATVRDLNVEVLRTTEHSITAEAVKSSSSNVIPAGSVVIATRVGLGKAVIIAQDTAINQDLRGLVVKKPKELIADYLYLWYLSTVHLVVAAGTGATVQGVKLPFVSGLAIPVPPLDEQKRIVALLDAANSRITELTAGYEKARTHANNLFTSALRDALESNQSAPLRTLDQLCDEGIVKLGRGNVISKRDIAEKPGSFPIYSSARENEGKFGEYGDYMFDEEMITWSIDGGGRLFYRPKHKFSVTNVGGTLRVLDPQLLDIQYLHKVLQNLHSQRVFDWVFKAHPSVIRKVYDAIPMPPLTEQKRIVARLDSMRAKTSEMVAAYDAKLTAAKNLRQSILEAAFAGDL